MRKREVNMKKSGILISLLVITIVLAWIVLITMTSQKLLVREGTHPVHLMASHDIETIPALPKSNVSPLLHLESLYEIQVTNTLEDVESKSIRDAREIEKIVALLTRNNWEEDTAGWDTIDITDPGYVFTLKSGKKMVTVNCYRIDGYVAIADNGTASRFRMPQEDFQELLDLADEILF